MRGESVGKTPLRSRESNSSTPEKLETFRLNYIFATKWGTRRELGVHKHPNVGSANKGTRGGLGGCQTQTGAEPSKYFLMKKGIGNLQINKQIQELGQILRTVSSA